MAMVPGVALYAYKATASSTRTAFTSSNPNFPHAIYVPADGAFMGMSYQNSGVALAVSLVDVTASKTIYSANLAANASGLVGPFTTTQYPMKAGNQHVMYFTGSGTANCILSPYYLSPAGSPSPSLGAISDFTCPQNTSFSSTGFYAQWVSSTTTTSQYARTFALPRNGALYSMSGTYIPALLSGVLGASVTATLADITAGTALASSVVTSNSTPQSTSFTSSPVAIPANHTIGMVFTQTPNTSLVAAGQVNFNIAVIL
jgi:hypothetical protein